MSEGFPFCFCELKKMYIYKNSYVMRVCYGCWMVWLIECLQPKWLIAKYCGDGK